MRATEIIEALLFASDAPLTAADLCRAHEDLDEDAVEQAILELRAEYDATGRAFQIYEIGGGYQLLTRPEYASVLERFHTVPQSGRLSGPALEVLAIIAYRQPIGRAEIEEIRGVGSAGVLRTLQERQLIDVVGRGEGLGRPLLYGTTQKFLEHFGFNSLHDLPRPDELPVVLKQRSSMDGAAASQQDAPATQPPAAEERSEAAAAQSAADAAPEAEAAPAQSAADAAPEVEAAAAEPVEEFAAAVDQASGAPEPGSSAAEPRADAPPESAPASAGTEPSADDAVPDPGGDGPVSPAVVDAPDHGSPASNGAGQAPSHVQAMAVEPGASAN